MKSIAEERGEKSAPAKLGVLCTGLLLQTSLARPTRSLGGEEQTGAIRTVFNLKPTDPQFQRNAAFRTHLLHYTSGCIMETRLA